MSQVFKHLLFFILIIIISTSLSYAEDTWIYKVIEDIGREGNTTDLIDIENSNIDIDYETREVRIPKMPLPDVAGFMPDGSYNYAILKEDGMSQFMFDSSEMVEIGSLSIDEENPLGIAISPYPYSVTINKAAEDNKNTNINNYKFDVGTMTDNPALSISGLEQVYSMSSFEDTGELIFLKKDKAQVYAAGDNELTNIPSLTIENIENPIAVATTQNYNIAVLEKENIKWYGFDGSKMVEIPALSISIDTASKPKSIAISEDTLFLLDDTKIKSYKYDNLNGKITEHAVLSINEGLIKPCTITLRKDTNDLIVVDEIDNINRDFKIRYFMYDGFKMVENEALSKIIKNVMGGIRYYSEGTLITNKKLTVASYADYIRVRAYVHVPEQTEITFYIANEGENIEDATWHESWKVSNYTGTPIVEKAILKFDGTREWRSFGSIENVYPDFDSFEDNDDFELTDDDINIIETPQGDVIININEDKQLLSLWNRIPIDDYEAVKTNSKYNKIRIKALLKTENPELSPKIFVPIGTNNEGGLIDAEERGLVWETNAIPLGPIIDPVDPNGGDDPPIKPPDDELEFTPELGWVYTTTPKIKWRFQDVDNDVDEDHIQIAYQLLVLGKRKEGSWHLAYNSKPIGINELTKELGKLKECIIPTSEDSQFAGPLWSCDAYEYAVFIKTWDSLGAVSKYSTGQRFKVLAFERPRIANIVYPSEGEYTSIPAPKLNEPSTHFVIKKGMSKASLPYVKAGAEVTLLVDSIGPIKTLPERIGKMFFDNEGSEEFLYMGKSEAVDELGLKSARNRWTIRFFTKAPITIIPDETSIKSRIAGEGEVGGITVFYIPNYSEGLIKTKETIYNDWQVILQGSDR